jgi:ethanolamine utilization microcompartment shell protein EutL
MTVKSESWSRTSPGGSGGWHQTIPVALSIGTDVFSSTGLDAALERADVVVDATNSPRSDEVAATLPFLTGTGRCCTTLMELRTADGALYLPRGSCRRLRCPI